MEGSIDESTGEPTIEPTSILIAIFALMFGGMQMGNA